MQNVQSGFEQRGGICFEQAVWDRRPILQNVQSGFDQRGGICFEQAVWDRRQILQNVQSGFDQRGVSVLSRQYGTGDSGHPKLQQHFGITPLQQAFILWPS